MGEFTPYYPSQQIRPRLVADLMSYHPVKETKTPPKLSLKKQNILLRGIPINLNLTQITVGIILLGKKQTSLM